jgi:cell division protein FtsN
MSVKWFTNTLITVFITMVFIYLIKVVSNKFNIPVVQDVANAV